MYLIFSKATLLPILCLTIGFIFLRLPMQISFCMPPASQCALVLSWFLGLPSLLQEWFRLGSIPFQKCFMQPIFSFKRFRLVLVHTKAKKCTTIATFDIATHLEQVWLRVPNFQTCDSSKQSHVSRYIASRFGLEKIGSAPNGPIQAS
jgi:hypothetical protein